MTASPETMRQVWITRHGPPEVLEVREAVAPEPGDNEVLIKVAAAGVNFADIMARLGLYPDAPKPPCVVGYEVAGEVTALGPSATGFAAGNKVIALTRFGGYSSHVSVRQEQVFALPTGLDFAQGAAAAGHLSDRVPACHRHGTAARGRDDTGPFRSRWRRPFSYRSCAGRRCACNRCCLGGKARRVAVDPGATATIASVRPGALPFLASRPRWAAADGSEWRAHFSACHGSASIRSR